MFSLKVIAPGLSLSSNMEGLTLWRATRALLFVLIVVAVGGCLPEEQQVGGAGPQVGDERVTQRQVPLAPVPPPPPPPHPDKPVTSLEKEAPKVATAPPPAPETQPSQEASGDDRLKAPFDLARATTLKGQYDQPYPCLPSQENCEGRKYGVQDEANRCSAPPPAVRDWTPERRYQRGTAGSVADPARYRRITEYRKTMYSFTWPVAWSSNRYVATRQHEVAACVLDWLSDWAQAGALLGDANSQGAFERTRALASISLSYLRIRDAAGLAPEKKGAVEGWIKKWTDVLANDARGLRGNRSRNNHSYWYAYAAGISGVVVNDRKLGLSDPGFFARETEKQQNWTGGRRGDGGRLVGYRIGWMEPYFARHQDPTIKPFLEKFRPTVDRDTKMDTTLLYGVE